LPLLHHFFRIKTRGGALDQPASAARWFLPETGMWPMRTANVADSASPFDSKEGIMAEADLISRTAQLDRRQFLAMAALATAAGSGIAATAAQALETAGPVPAQPAEGNVDAWNLGLITAHRPEFTPAENRRRMGELRADIGDRFGLLQVRGRYVPNSEGAPIEERAFLLRGKADDSGNLKGFLRKAGRKFDQEAMILKGDGQDAILFALKELPALGLVTGDKKNLGRFRLNQIGRYHALLARGWDVASGQWEELVVWTTISFFNRQPRQVFV
jgi:hypothetical protein